MHDISNDSFNNQSIQTLLTLINASLHQIMIIQKMRSKIGIIYSIITIK